MVLSFIRLTTLTWACTRSSRSASAARLHRAPGVCWESTGRTDTCSTYTSIRGASWSRRLRALSIASALEASRVRWLSVVVRCVSRACHATMADPTMATTTAAMVHT